MSITFQPATRQQLLAKVALYGPSKSGKSLSALLLARGVVGPTGRLAVADTEGDRVRLYAADPRLVTDGQPAGFDHFPMSAPFTSARFVSLITSAHQQGYDALVIDSISPFWEGPGGVKSIVDNSRESEKFKKWGEANPHHNAIISAITNAPLHVFCTMRAKTAYEVERGDDGKTKIRKLGLQPVQRDQMEYEFDVLIAMDAAHAGSLEARGSFQDRVVPFPGIALGEELRTWLLAGGGQVANDAPAAAPAPAPVERVTRQSDMGTQVGMIDTGGGKFWIAEADVAHYLGQGWTLAAAKTAPAAAADAPAAHPSPAEPVPADPPTDPAPAPSAPTPESSANGAGAGLPMPEQAVVAKDELGGGIVRTTDDQKSRLAGIAVDLQKLKPDIQWGDYLNTVAGERYNSKDGVAGLQHDQAEELIELAEQTKLNLDGQAVA